MKKVAILLALFCMLTVTASAAYIPEDVICLLYTSDAADEL